MKSFSYLPIFLFLFSITLLGQVDFVRDTIPVNPISEPGGYGNIISGLDLDGDGKTEIYAVGTNVIAEDEPDDRPGELIPRIYKFEFNGTSWDSVWGATLGHLKQNTWPPFVLGDLDGDEKMELIWGPVNFITETSTNPSRIVIFEAPGGNEEYMGVDDGTGTGNYLPNVEYPVITEENQELRLIKFIVNDIDSDGHDELLFTERSGSSGYAMHFGVLSIDNVPDDGNGSETWTLEASGKNDPLFNDTGTKYDIAVLNNYLYIFSDNGAVYPVKYENNTWTTLPAPMIPDSAGSFLSAQTVDIDKDGTSEIVYGGWFSGSMGGMVYLLQPDGDSLIQTKIANLAKLGIPRINGGDNGDINGDGKIDFVFGSRNGATPNNAIGWVQYLGGDIADSNSYTVKLIDSLYAPVGYDMYEIAVANLDEDVPEEIVYTSGYTRGVSDDHPADIIILDYTGDISITPISENVPSQYYLDQNFPNPFNPVTTIRFGLQTEAPVDLKIYDVLGREVAVLIKNTRMKPGQYDVTFDASSLASGTYIYRLTTGSVSVSRKMSLLK